MTVEKDRSSLATTGRTDAVKLPWKAPEIQTMEARDGEANLINYGGFDSGIYHS